MGIAPVIPPPPAVPAVDFPNVPPPPPPELEAAAPAVTAASSPPAPNSTEEPATAAATVEEAEPVTSEPASAPPALDRESAPPPVEAIAPVTFSERPPAVATKDEAAAVKPSKEVDPTPSGPVRSETPLSTGPETFDPVTSFEPARRGPNWALIGAAAAVVLLVGYWIQRGPAGPKKTDTATAAPVEALKVETPKVEEPKLEAPKLEVPTAAASDSQPSEAPSAAAEKSAEVAPTPAPSVSAAEAAKEAAPEESKPVAAEGTKTISVVTRPAGARLFERGKEVGTTPLTLELAPGEKRKFEVGLPGHTTRKLIVDGTKTEIYLGMRPEK